jgi:hypothetical protein
VKAIPKGAEWVCIYTWKQIQPRWQCGHEAGGCRVFVRHESFEGL